MIWILTMPRLIAPSQRQITVVVPQLSLGTDKLGDYCLSLARQLRQDFGIDSQFIVTDPTWPHDSRLESFTVRSVFQRKPESLLAQLKLTGASTVLIHYAHTNEIQPSCPAWVLEGLTQWRQGDRTHHLVTMFHDLYSFGPLWTGAFWMSPLQRKLISRLARLSDRILTNRQGNTTKLWMLSRGKHTSVPALPTFSNIGEPPEVLPLLDRPRSLVVIGKKSDRQTLYRKSYDILITLCEALGIDVIYDIGSPLLMPMDCIGSTPVHAIGLNPPEVTSKLLSSATVGFTDSDPASLATSTAFAAFCAHGLIPICSTPTTEVLETDRLVPNRHYWHAPNHLPDINWEVGQAIATRAHRWYQAHNLKVHARIFAQCLFPGQTAKRVPTSSGINSLAS